MTAAWSTDWGQVSHADRVYHFALYADGWHVVHQLSTLTVITGNRQAALDAIAALDDKIKGGGGGST
jgi:hypothetical protein